MLKRSKLSVVLFIPTQIHADIFFCLWFRVIEPIINVQPGLENVDSLSKLDLLQNALSFISFDRHDKFWCVSDQESECVHGTDSPQSSLQLQSNTHFILA